MLRNKYIMTGIMCIFACAQGAASDAGTQAVGSKLSAHTLKLKDCFNPETIPMRAPDRCYRTFAISKRYSLTKSTAFPKSVFVTNDAECSGIMGCIGIVEGSDAELTGQTADRIEDIITQDAWDACSLPFRSKERESIYLNAALRSVINGSFDRLNRTKDICVSLVWFHSEKSPEDKRNPIETREGSVFIPLREVILPPIGISTLKSIELCHAQDALPAERIELLKAYAKYSRVSHDSTVLRIIPMKLAAFLKQEFGE